jgi:hypothetical protein
VNSQTRTLQGGNRCISTTAWTLDANLDLLQPMASRRVRSLLYRALRGERRALARTLEAHRPG